MQGGEVIVFAYVLPLLIYQEVLDFIQRGLSSLAVSVELLHQPPVLPERALYHHIHFANPQQNHRPLASSSSSPSTVGRAWLLLHRLRDRGQQWLWWQVRFWSLSALEQWSSLLLTVLWTLLIYFYAFVISPLVAKVGSETYTITATVLIVVVALFVCYLVYSEVYKQKRRGGTVDNNITATATARDSRWPATPALPPISEAGNSQGVVAGDRVHETSGKRGDPQAAVQVVASASSSSSLSRKSTTISYTKQSVARQRSSEEEDKDEESLSWSWSSFDSSHVSADSSQASSSHSDSSSNSSFASFQLPAPDDDEDEGWLNTSSIDQKSSDQ